MPLQSAAPATRDPARRPPARLAPAASRGAIPAFDDLGFLCELQTSLDPAELLLTFSTAIAAAVPHCGLGLDHAVGAVVIGDARGQASEWPVTTGEHAVGTLRLYGRHPVSNHRIPLLTHAVRLLAQPLRNALICEELRRQAREDPLTGLLNRAALDMMLPREISLARREGTSLCLLMLDLDNFKQINDSLGHGTGDQVLRAVADVLRACLRQSDLAFRYGGEEFVVVLPDTDGEGGCLTAERIRTAISAHAASQLPCAVTGSIGVAMTGRNLRRSTTLLERADRALYRAKSAGRNRVLAA